MTIYRPLQTHHVEAWLPVELTVPEGIQATCLPPTMHRSPGVQTQNPGPLSHTIHIQEAATLAATVTTVGPLETMEAACPGILMMAMATLDARKAGTLGTLSQIHGDLTFQMTLRTLVLIHGDTALQADLMLHTPVCKHGYTTPQVAVTLHTLVQIHTYLLPRPDVGTLMLRRRLGRRIDRLGIPRARRDEWVEPN